MLHLDASSKRVSIYRDVQLNSINGTVWCSFLVLKEKGNSRLGFSLEKGVEERIFVEAKQTREPQLVVVRIDFSDEPDKVDKAMFFIVLLLLPFLTWKMLNIPYLVNLILIVLKSCREGK